MRYSELMVTIMIMCRCTVDYQGYVQHVQHQVTVLGEIFRIMTMMT